MNDKMQDSLLSIVKLYDAQAYEEAIHRGKEFTKQFPENGNGWNVLGLSYKASAKIPEALEIFEYLVKAAPNSAAFRSNLGNTYMLIGKIRRAVSSLKKAVKLDPKLTNAVEALGLAFLEIDQKANALKCFKRVIQLDPNNQRSLYYLGNLHLNDQDWKGGEKYLKQSHFGLSQSHYLECLLGQERDKEFDDLYKVLSDKGITNPLIGGLVAHAREVNGRRLNNTFCNNSIDYIYVGQDREANGFSEKLTKDLITYHHSSRNDYRSQALLHKGSQSSGNIFLLNEPFVTHLRESIEKQIKEYRLKFRDSSQGFLKQWPEKYKLFGWMVSITTGGNLDAHNHKEGWLSGSFYLSLPERSGASGDAGKIAFSYKGPRYPASDKVTQKKVIDIRERDICMFPSSLFHETIPFEGDEERISFAFDVIPLNNDSLRR